MPVESSLGAVSAIAVPFTSEFRNSRIRLRQGLLIREENDAEVLRAGFLTEAGAVDDHDVLLADEFLHKSLITVRDLNARKGIERAARSNTADAWRLLAPLLREIAAGTQLPFDLDEMILRTFQRWLDGVLLGMIGAKSRA